MQPRELNPTEEELCKLLLERMSKEYSKPLKNDRSEFEKGYQSYETFNQ